jgi:hypothetical protein
MIHQDADLAGIDSKVTIQLLSGFLEMWPPRETLPEFHGVTHYSNDSASAEWLAAMREMYCEGERTPIQAEPHPVVMDEQTPSLLRRQAA